MRLLGPAATVVAFSLLSTFATARLSAADPPRPVKQIESELADVKKRLRELEAELDAARSANPRAPKLVRINADTIAIGVYGRFGDERQEYPFEVTEVRNPGVGKSPVLYLARVIGPDPMEVLISGYPEKGTIADGKRFREQPVWKVHNTVRVNGRTVYSLRPATPAELNP